MKIVTAMPYGGYVILMSRVKDIRLKVIPSNVANDFIKKNHYSGKVMQNSSLHFGAFLDDILHGVMSFGSPIDKRKVLNLVNTDNTNINSKWNEMLELNRMAFDEVLPKYSESRCISIATKLIKKNAPHIKWILSFADGTQCGDGTIYRASGFDLMQIKRNSTIYKLSSGEIAAKHGTSKKNFIQARKLKGFQLAYIYKLSKDCEYANDPIPFSEIEGMGASMYRGKKICDVGVKRSTASFQDVGGGAIPTTSLHLNYA